MPYLIEGCHNRRPPAQAVPLAASQQLAKSLAMNYADSQALCQMAIRKMTNWQSKSELLGRPVKDLLREARQEDNALFVQEKQNLFIDEVREALVWSRVLRSLSPSGISRDLAQKFTVWVIEGLQVLKDTADAEEDGPLGWSSKAEVFTLGMQVIFGAEVLLRWRTRTRKVTKPGSGIRRALRELADVGAKNELHPMWLDTIEKILEASIIERLRIVKEAMTRLSFSD